MRFKALAVLLLAVMMIGAQAATASAASAERDVTGVVTFTAPPVPVSGGWSALVRNGSGVSMTLRTTGLTPGHAITVWWIVFNQPGNCTHGAFGLRCGEADLFEAPVQASVLYAAGHIIGGSGTGNYGATLRTGDTGGSLFGPGLVNPWTADVHLILHDHGAVEPGSRSSAIHSFGTCNPDCVDVQASAHES